MKGGNVLSISNLNAPYPQFIVPQQSSSSNSSSQPWVIGLTGVAVCSLLAGAGLLLYDAGHPNIHRVSTPQPARHPLGSETITRWSPSRTYNRDAVVSVAAKSPSVHTQHAHEEELHGGDDDTVSLFGDDDRA